MSGFSKARPPLPEGPYLIVGLARSGQAAAALLAGRGEQVIAVDSAAPAGAAGLAGVGVEVILDVDGVEAIERVRCVVKSPGVPATAPAIAAARERGLAIIGELELAWRLLPNRFCAVTGTNGKTTVAELLGHIWRTAGEEVAVAGNVGTPLSSLVGRVAGEATIVCEASSFQLEDTEAFDPECGVLLNLTPDHLDRYASVDEYLAAKLRIFANQVDEDACVYNGSDPLLAGVDLGGCARRLAFCREPSGDDCQAGPVGSALELWGEPLIDLDDLPLPGAHNAENAAAAALAAAAMGVDRDAIAAGLRSFGGVAHRLELVAEIDGVRYVNDSKATNVAAADAALRSFEPGVHAILGGSLKGEAFTDLAPAVIGHARRCYLIGQAADRLEADLAEAWDAGVERVRCPDLPAAVAAAADAARPGEVVLLAPACASFDAYRDFEQRGEHFRALVETLAGERR